MALSGGSSDNSDVLREIKVFFKRLPPNCRPTIFLVYFHCVPRNSPGR